MGSAFLNVSCTTGQVSYPLQPFPYTFKPDNTWFVGHLHTRHNNPLRPLLFARVRKRFLTEKNPFFSRTNHIKKGRGIWCIMKYNMWCSIRACWFETSGFYVSMTTLQGSLVCFMMASLFLANNRAYSSCVCVYLMCICIVNNILCRYSLTTSIEIKHVCGFNTITP